MITAKDVPNIYKIDMLSLGLLIKDTMVDGQRATEILRLTGDGIQRTAQYPTTQEAWAEMWGMLVREWGGVPSWFHEVCKEQE